MGQAGGNHGYGRNGHVSVGLFEMRRSLMTRKGFGTAILALVGLGIFAGSSQAQTSSPKQPSNKRPTTAQQNVPAEYQAGIAELRIAKGYLEKAGDKWGGYRVRAIATIDRAFKMVGVSPESTPQEMESGNVDEPGMMDSGMSSLQTAKGDFEEAGDDWGGRREKALSLINQALNDLQAGIDWAKEHKTY
jgi:hypothetical protein